VKALLRHVPNALTGLRLVAAPATAGLLVAGHFNAAFGVFALAGVSDAADGYLAKRFGLTTPLGRILDPAADKALMLAAFVTLACLGALPIALAAIVIGRDLCIVLGLGVAAMARAPIPIQPLLLGKLATALQLLYIGIHLASLAFRFPLDAVEPADAYVVAATTIASALGYGVIWFNAMGQGRSEAGRRA
jgi:cardiolipin synthase